MLSIHLELLDKKRQETFKKLKVFRKDAVLAGGTALLLQIGHRQSYDFDLFLERRITKNDYLVLKRIFGINQIKLNTRKQLTVLTKNKISITLVNVEYKSLFKKIDTEYLKLSSVKEIALDKAFTIGRRALWRDYVDLFFILKEKNIDIGDIIKLAEKKYNPEFNPTLFLEQLIYFNDLRISEIAFIKKKYSTNEIKIFLKKELKKFKNKF